MSQAQLRLGAILRRQHDAGLVKDTGPLDVVCNSRVFASLGVPVFPVQRTIVYNPRQSANLAHGIYAGLLLPFRGLRGLRLPFS